MKYPKRPPKKNIWETFKIVFDNIEPEDEIVFDITHGFRSSPMLLMVLINYAKFLKKITVRKIVYGAFEARDKEKNETKIWDLTNFAVLQDWTSAANEFLNYGSAISINKLVKNSDDISSNFAELLNEYTNMIKASRGRDIVNGVVAENIFKKADLVKKETSFKALTPLVDKMKNVVDGHIKEDINNGLLAVKFCIDHSLIQQGITLLTEHILTYSLHETNFDFDFQFNRDIASRCLTVRKKSTYRYMTDENDEKYEKENELVNVFFEWEYHKKMGKIYSSLSIGSRHDINHAGYRSNAKNLSELSSSLQKYYNKFINLIQ